MKPIAKLLLIGAVAVGLSALVSTVAQQSMSGRVAPTPAPQFALADPIRPGKVVLNDVVQGRKAVLVNFWFYS
jgi:hypothetical protein